MITPVLMKIAKIKKGSCGDALFCQLQARAIIQLKILLSMELRVRTGRVVERIIFDSRTLIPLVTKVQNIFTIQLKDNQHILEENNLAMSNTMLPIAGIYFEKGPSSLNFTRMMLSHNKISVPMFADGQLFSSEKTGNCKLIIDAEAFMQKARKVNCIIADHQLFIYHGKQFDVFVGAISLVTATVYIVDTGKK